MWPYHTVAHFGHHGTLARIYVEEAKQAFLRTMILSTESFVDGLAARATVETYDHIR